MKKIIFITILLILTALSVHAEEYYADTIIDINPDGSAQISGTTNHPVLENTTTSEFTSMEKGTWKIQINPDGNFTAYIFEIILPQNTQTTSIKTSGEYRITTKDNRLAVIVLGEKNQPQISIEYKTNNATEPPNYVLMAVAIIILAGIIVIAHGRTNPKNKETPQKLKSAIHEDALTERQKSIIEYLRKKGQSATQKEIETTLNLPKASLSRNLSALERKDIIEKEEKGMTKIVRLKE